jgi:hypothetical protein
VSLVLQAIDGTKIFADVSRIKWTLLSRQKIKKVKLMSVIIFLKEKSSGHGNVENFVKFPKYVIIKAFTLIFFCGKAVENVWKICGKLIEDFHSRHSMMRFILTFPPV